MIPRRLDEFDAIPERVAELEAIVARDRDSLKHIDAGRRQPVAPVVNPDDR
jgi:hypothetical protein